MASGMCVQSGEKHGCVDTREDTMKHALRPLQSAGHQFLPFVMVQTMLLPVGDSA